MKCEGGMWEVCVVWKVCEVCVGGWCIRNSRKLELQLGKFPHLEHVINEESPRSSRPKQTIQFLRCVCWACVCVCGGGWVGGGILTFNRY